MMMVGPQCSHASTAAAVLVQLGTKLSGSGSQRLSLLSKLHESFFSQARVAVITNCAT